MNKTVFINQKIESFDKEILIEGDKSLSIRWVLFSSLASGVSKCHNLLMSEDVFATINAVKKFGIKVKLKNRICKIYGKGLHGYDIKNNTIINARNSGTLGRLILGLLINSKKTIKLIGDKSLSKRDFKRVSDPLKKFGVAFKLHNNSGLPLTMLGTNSPKPIHYLENRGSAQCKSSVIFAGLRTPGTTIIKAKKSRNHTELLCKYLKLPIKIINKKNYDLIKVSEAKKIKPLNYIIPSDISSSTFFIVLTALSKNSKLQIKNVNVNSSRIAALTILKKMGVKILFKNKKIYKGEKISDIVIKSAKNIKPINCPTKLNSGAIDEFLVIFLVAAKAKGISYFKDLAELNKKESPRLIWGSKILNMMGVKTVLTSNSIKIYGNPNLIVKKKVVIKNYLKDHRVFMSSVIAALSFGGNWKIHDKDSINTSFPSFIKKINYLKK
jgi:3-phosphoshikimate 1-carboxyvinyltransferase